MDLLRKIGVVALVAICLTHAQRLQADVTFDTIALSGSAGTSLGRGPGLGGDVVFTAFDYTTLNAAGQVAFHGTLAGGGIVSGNDKGIWANAGGSIAAVAREGSDGPGPNLGAGVHFDSMGTFGFNAAGQVAFVASVAGAGIDATNNLGLWTNMGGSLAAIAREGNSSPGPNLGAGVNFRSIDSLMAFTSTGLVTGGTVNGTGITATNDGGIWSVTGGSLTIVAREGSSGPGPNLDAGVNFGTFSRTTMNPSGKSAFKATLSGTGIDATNDSGIWTNVGGSFTVAARSGSAGPGPNLGSGVQFKSFDDPLINGAGAIAFGATVSGSGIDATNQQGIWTTVGGSLNLVARTGSEGPGPNLGAGVYFDEVAGLPNLLFNAAGAVTFAGSVTGAGITTANNFGIWTNVGGTLVAVAREGSVEYGPGLGDGVYFGGDIAKDLNLAMNGVGEIVFKSSLVGTGVTTANDMGIWAWSKGQLLKVVREGDTFDVNPDPLVQDLRTVGSLSYLQGDTFASGSGGEDGKRMALNDQGLLALRLLFADGSSGVFTAQLPREPGDFNGDGQVDGGDFGIWQSNFPKPSGGTMTSGDADGDGDVDGADFVAWQTSFGAAATVGVAVPVPEPATGWMMLTAAVVSGGSWLLRSVSRRRC